MQPLDMINQHLHLFTQHLDLLLSEVQKQGGMDMGDIKNEEKAISVLKIYDLFDEPYFFRM